MNALRHLMPPTQALRRLADFLEETGNPLTAAEAATRAIEDWIAAQRGFVIAGGFRPTRGYMWKSLFLPEGTELRMEFRGRSYSARVEGDAIVFEGAPVSPRQMTLAVAGDGRNAWRDLAVRLPGSTKWKSAAQLRREIASERRPEDLPPAAPVSPAEALATAAAAMSDTLKSALALVEHANAQSLPRYERRVTRQRRADDVLAETCKLD